MSTPASSPLWALADLWEGRWRDKRNVMPIERFVWKTAWEELTKILGDRVMSTEVQELK